MELRVTDLACARGGLTILGGVNFRVGAGEGLMLRGPNGIGKTTLLRTLAGLHPPLAGAVSLPPEAIAYAGHADGVKSALTVAENLGFWARVFGARHIGPALEAFGLASLGDRPARNLSAGQRRRLGLARLLVSGRPIWLMDEPIVSLDAEAADSFAAAIEAHLSGGGAAVVATHSDLRLAASTLDLTPFRPAAPAVAPGFEETFA